MNSKHFLTLATLGAAAALTATASAQNTGTAGTGTTSAGGSIHSTTTTTADTAAPATGTTAGAPSTASAAGSDVGALRPPGQPDMSPSMPNRSVIDRGANNDPAASGGSNLPQGISAVPPRPGVSPISGLPTSELPAVSRGTNPIGPQASTNRAPDAGQRQPTTTTEPVAGAAHPEANTQIGMGTTTVVPTPPPAAHIETPVTETATDGSQTWVPGHYSWLGGQWTWIEGGWQRPPTPSAAWVPGNYDAQNHRWTEGHWDTAATAVSRNREAVRQNDGASPTPTR